MYADIIIRSKALFTGLTDDAAPGSLAIIDDRIAYVGSNEGAAVFRGPDTTVVDYGEALVIAGFHDSHLHFFHSALYASSLAMNYLGTSEEDYVAHLDAFAQGRPQGDWLLAQGWREYRWDPPDLPSKHSLDDAYPDRPVALYSGDAHTLWVNSIALAVLGIDRESRPPQGGSYDRDDNGDLTGIIRETAAMELMPRIVASFTDADLCDAYCGFIDDLVAHGITSVCDLSLMALPGLDFVREDLFEAIERDGKLAVRVNLFPTLLEDTGRLESLRKRLTGPKLRAPGFKQFFDGVSSQHTAWLTEPYTNAYFEGDCGSPTTDPDTMRTLVLAAAAQGHAVRIHAIGDRAIHTALDIFAEARSLYGPPTQGQNSLEHLENLLVDDIRRCAELDVLASVQPPHITLDPGGPERDLGCDRTRWMWPFASFLDAGAKLAFGTDSPVVGIDPMNVLYAAVTRKDPHTHEPHGGWITEECLSMPDAIRAYTLGSAQAAHRSDDLGTLEVGKLADIAVLDRNLLVLCPDDIQSTRIIATYVGGECVYRAPSGHPSQDECPIYKSQR